MVPPEFRLEPAHSAMRRAPTQHETPARVSLGPAQAALGRARGRWLAGAGPLATALSRAVLRCPVAHTALQVATRLCDGKPPPTTPEGGLQAMERR